MYIIERGGFTHGYYRIKERTLQLDMDLVVQRDMVRFRIARLPFHPTLPETDPSISEMFCFLTHAIITVS